MQQHASARRLKRVVDSRVEASRATVRIEKVRLPVFVVGKIANNGQGPIGSDFLIDAIHLLGSADAQRRVSADLRDSDVVKPCRATHEDRGIEIDVPHGTPAIIEDEVRKETCAGAEFEVRRDEGRVIADRVTHHVRERAKLARGNSARSTIVDGHHEQTITPLVMEGIGSSKVQPFQRSEPKLHTRCVGGSIPIREVQLIVGLAAEAVVQCC